MKYKVKTLNKISKGGLSQLAPELFTYGDDVDSPDAILVRSADMHSYELGKNLRCIARAGAGTNNIPIAKCSEEGVVVFNTPGANANAVCELTLCALFLASRDIVGGIKWVDSLIGEGDKVPALVEKGKSAFIGPETNGKTLGVVGLGAIGVMVANAATKLNMDVYGYDPYISVTAAWKLDRYVKHAQNLDVLYEHSDYITLHVPYMDSTKGMINKDSIAKMKDGVSIINFSRGELVNDDDIIAALESGKVRRYITDFPTERLIKTKNVITIPHLGASTPESEENCAVMAVAELRDYLVNGNIKNSVNYPDVHMDRSGSGRLCMLHRNIPGEIEQILSLLSAEKVNIENMINKSKKEYAYTMIDLNTKVSEAILDKIRGLEGMLRLRVIMDA